MKHSMDFHTQRNKLLILTGALFVCALFCVSLFIGKYPLSLNALMNNDPMQWRIFWNLRFCRVFLGCVGGIVLGMSGYVFQMIFRNPLASPDILGVSSGASAGAAFGILFFANTYAVIVFSFAGAVLAVVFTLLFASVDRSGNKMTVVLAGIAVHAVAQMVLMLLKGIADPEKELASIEYWIMGGLNGIRMKTLLINVPIGVICLVLLLFMHRQSLLLSMDEIESKMLGVKVARMRIMLLLLATLAVASVVSITGIISFVGLLAPHCARKLTKSNQVETMILSGILGGGFLMIADILARSVAQYEFPVSVFTSMFGVPFLILLIVRGRVRE